MRSMETQGSCIITSNAEVTVGSLGITSMISPHSAATSATTNSTIALAKYCCPYTGLAVLILQKGSTARAAIAACYAGSRKGAE